MWSPFASLRAGLCGRLGYDDARNDAHNVDAAIPSLAMHTYCFTMPSTVIPTVDVIIVCICNEMGLVTNH